ncbi:small multi-drug export protein [Alteribacillus sp. JSM 102045]|uniref:small multi-drug export protein n=1 Tax=Alteribacillus sp. JSM 102045 TaxID=1562101 RepID=UPI0035C25E63
MLEVIGWYISIFLMAATPWLELLVVIPIGIGAGLNPVIVGVVAFVGNALPVFLLIYGMHWIKELKWIKKWKDRKLIKRRSHIKKHEDDEEKLAKKQARKEKMQRIFNKYGVAGLALAGPGVTGIHLATIFAMAFKANKRKVVLWMNLSLALWTLAMTAASFYGIEWLTALFG